MKLARELLPRMNVCRVARYMLCVFGWFDFGTRNAVLRGTMRGEVSFLTDSAGERRKFSPVTSTRKARQRPHSLTASPTDQPPTRSTCPRPKPRCPLRVPLVRTETTLPRRAPLESDGRADWRGEHLFPSNPFSGGNMLRASLSLQSLRRSAWLTFAGVGTVNVMRKHCV